MNTTVYIIVRNTEDSEFNSISSFMSVHLTVKSARKTIKAYAKDFCLPIKECGFEILERVAE